MRQKPKPGPDNDPTTPPLQRRTLLQLALAASAGAAMPAAVVAQTPTPTPTPYDQGLKAALDVVLDRATNFLSANANPNLPYNKIWSAVQIGARNAWFTNLKNITVAAPLAISADETPHTGRPRAGLSNSDQSKYDNTVRAAMLAKDQIETARKRVQHLLLVLEREAFWCTYQVAYRDGYCQAVTDKPDRCVWNLVEVKGLSPTTLCDVEKKCHTPQDLEANKLSGPPPELFEPNLCPEGLVFGHEGY